MSGGRIVLLVIGAILALVGLGLGAAGGTLLWVHQTQRDADGFFTSAGQVYRTDGYAIASQEIDLGSDPEDARWISDLGDLARVRVTVRDAGTGPLFVGIGPLADVEAYLRDVPRSEVAEVDFEPFRARYDEIPGTRAPAPPGAQAFWAARATGNDPGVLEWEVEGGRWMLVVMNADPAPGVAADVQLGVRIDVLLPIAIGLLVAGIVLLASGATMVVLGARGRGGGRPVAAGPDDAAATPAAAENDDPPTAGPEPGDPA